MKRTILLVALLIFSVSAFAQQRVFTESVYNQYKHYSAATAANGDTVVNVVGAQTGYPNPALTVLPYLCSVVINTPVASGTVTILDGGTTVMVVTLTATPVASPFDLPIYTKLGTSLVVKITGTMDVTIVYRTWR